MKRILVPTDLSEIAERGLKLAVEIARRTGAEIYLTNFTRHPFNTTFSAMGEVTSKVDQEVDLYNLELLQANRSKLNLLGANYSMEGVTINTEIIDDELKGGIDAFLHDNTIDLVVMGTSGEENIKEQFTGNHTEQIIGVSTCPVISVRDDFNIENFQHIVLALDVIEPDSKLYYGLHVLKEIADCFDATIHLVHVTDPHIRMYSDLEGHFTVVATQLLFKKYEVHVLLDEKDEAEAVMEYAEQVQAGLMAVLKNSKDGVFHIFSDHFSDKVVKKLGQPIFTYNLQNA